MSKNNAVSNTLDNANIVQKAAVVTVAIVTLPIWLPICVLWSLLDLTDE